MHRYLTEHEIDVIFACFGMNESFGGAESLPQFQADLAALVEDLQAHRYNSASAPRIVLVSPIAHEDLGDHLPDGIEHNESLRQYTEAIAEAAEQFGLPFVDLFTPTQELYSTTARDLTSNGIHLTSYGYWTVSQIMARSLGLVDTIAPLSATADPTAGSLRRAIYDKNYSFFFRWRAPNMEYIHGQRRTLPGAELMPEELEQLADIIEQLDAKIWGDGKAEARRGVARASPRQAALDQPAAVHRHSGTPDRGGRRAARAARRGTRQGHPERRGRTGVLSSAGRLRDQSVRVRRGISARQPDGDELRRRGTALGRQYAYLAASASRPAAARTRSSSSRTAMATASPMNTPFSSTSST